MITTILFDLDGTLLPMDQDTFVGAYVKGLAAIATPYGYEPRSFAKTVMAGTVAMVKNGGRQTNEEAFWNILIAEYGDVVKSHYHIFDQYYQTGFQKIKDVCGFTPQAADIIHTVKDLGYRVALATNPLFPSVATESRIRWAGIQPQDFEFFTSYENSHYCKPNLDYYREVLARLGVSAEECLMVGNDVNEDMIAEQLGMKTFLLTDCLINKDSIDITKYPQGSLSHLKKYIENINNEE